MPAGFDSLGNNKISMRGLDCKGFCKASSADADGNSERMGFFNYTFRWQAKMKTKDRWSSPPNGL